MAWKSWHSWIVIALLGALSVPSLASHLVGAPITRLVAWIITMLLIALALVIIGLGVNGRVSGVLIDSQNRYALARLQLILWVVVIFGALLVAALLNLFGGAPEPLNIVVPKEVWALVGVSGSALAGATIVKGSKLQQQPTPIAKQEYLRASRRLRPVTESEVDRALRSDPRFIALLTEERVCILRSLKEAVGVWLPSDSSFVSLPKAQQNQIVRWLSDALDPGKLPNLAFARLPSHEGIPVSQWLVDTIDSTLQNTAGFSSLPPNQQDSVMSWLAEEINTALQTNPQFVADQAYRIIEIRKQLEQDYLARRTGQVAAMGLLAVKEKPQDASVGDLFTGDEVGNSKNVEIAKVQMLLFTIVLVATYGVAIGKMFLGPAIIQAFPSFPTGELVLLGISQAVYLTDKAASHTQQAPPGGG